jgi:hypothetical protein
MKYEIYSDITSDDYLDVFEFESLGKNGSIHKRVAFIPTVVPQVYNLAFGDIIERDEIDDYSISNNGDRNKILATLAKIIKLYTDKYPERWIYFEGSTKNRTRLYRMAVGLNLEELSDKFEIFGEVGNNMEFLPFKKNMEINAFLIRKKIV